jgi:class 3 adenylate cyclase
VAELPSGTVTFLFTDVEGSTRLWDEYPEAMQAALAAHDAILRGAVEAGGGHVVKTTGDGIHAVFATARDALDAAVAMQLGLAAGPFEEPGRLRVRMGCTPVRRKSRFGDYYGSEVNRACALDGRRAWRQIVVSLATSALGARRVGRVDRSGEHRLRDLATLSAPSRRARRTAREFSAYARWTRRRTCRSSRRAFVGRDVEVKD